MFNLTYEYSKLFSIRDYDIIDRLLEHQKIIKLEECVNKNIIHLFYLDWKNFEIPNTIQFLQHKFKWL